MNAQREKKGICVQVGGVGVDKNFLRKKASDTINNKNRS
jgi:hypothetical protein